uniref:Fibronectin type-III domain-containing protein n=1 Tax=Corethron hystrix TaxID=216773 RepID=A0A6U5H1H0_9STRA
MTGPLSIVSRPEDIEEALHNLTNLAVASVSREDHSSYFNTTVLESHSFEMVFRITFIPTYSDEQFGNLTVTDASSGITFAVAKISESLHEYSVETHVRPPSNPEMVELWVVSNTELGMTWKEPTHDGGAKVDRYLVEWDDVYTFQKSKVTPQNPYSNLEDGPTTWSEVVSTLSHQIVNLNKDQEYFVRVSACNAAGCSPAVSSAPSSSIPADVPPHLPAAIRNEVSRDEVPDRIHVEWSLPNKDQRGFVTEPDACGSTVGHTPNLPLWYEFTWENPFGIERQSSYRARMVEGDGQVLHCCPAKKCLVELGAEVQTLSVSSNENKSLSKAKFKVLYLGKQSRQAKVRVASGSPIVSVSSYPNDSHISIGDYIKINESVHQILQVDNSTVTLSSDYIGDNTDAELVAYYNTPPNACFDAVNGNSALELSAHIEEGLDNSPFDESISVSRSTLDPSSGHGFMYHITFIGPAFSGDVSELLVLSKNLSPWSDSSCGKFKVGDTITTRASLSLVTDFDAGTFVPGIPYSLQVAAVNNAGTGMSTPANPASVVPCAPPGLPIDARVLAVSDDHRALKVTWREADLDHGAKLRSYKVFFYLGGILESTRHVDVNPMSQSYTIVQTNLEAYALYIVKIRAVNDQGEGGPGWYDDVSNSDGSLEGRYEDFVNRSAIAVPTCAADREGCEELDSKQVMTRGVPGAPFVDAGTYPSASSSSQRFSKVSIFVIFASDDPIVDKFRVEWSTDRAFTNKNVHVTTNSEYLISSLTMGKDYFVRVYAHNSAGYGLSSDVLPVRPIQSPDPPFGPTLNILSTENNSEEKVATSLLLNWAYPIIDNEDGRPDSVGDGGDAITHYFIEWSKMSWDNYVPTVWKINARDSNNSGTNIEGAFRLKLDTTFLAGASHQAPFMSANVSVMASAHDLEIILENMPNIGDVEVSTPAPKSWIVTFISEVGNLENFSIYSYSVHDKGTEFSGTIDIQMLQSGYVPASASYMSDKISVLENEDLSYKITNIFPGLQYFARISSCNVLGCSSFRLTAPASLAPPIGKPELCSSFFHAGSGPSLHVVSPTSLMVRMGPPGFDGGAPLTNFMVEWDQSVDFDSSVDGTPFGQQEVNAMKSICSGCIDSFDISTHTFSYSGDEHVLKILIPQRRFMVHFKDGTHNIFTIVLASLSVIIVSDDHKRSSSDGTGNYSLAADIFILGNEYIINNLIQGKKYFVRVSASNSELGYGLPVYTVPSSIIPIGSPPPVKWASLSVIDKNSLRVSWFSKDNVVFNEISSYRIERFTKSAKININAGSSRSFFGTPHIVRLSSANLGLTGGTFSLAFGDYVIQHGTVKVVPGLDYVETMLDFTPSIARGDSIFINGLSFRVHEKNSYTSTQLPLSRPYDGLAEEEVNISSQYKSMEIPFDASQQTMEMYIENIVSVGQVQVRRTPMHPNGYYWYITFVSDLGPQPPFIISTIHLIGTNPSGLSQQVIESGILPENYDVQVVNNSSETSLDFHNLLTGVDYYVRILASSSRGDGELSFTHPSNLSPGGVPGAPYAS